MHTTTILSEKSPAKTCIYIKGDFRKSAAYKYCVNNTAGKSNKKEKAIVRCIPPTSGIEKSINGKYRYILQPGDNKRLSRDGVLRLYSINKAIDIPVRKLLGKWKAGHIGVALVVLDGQWCIEGELVEHMHKPERGVLVALRLLLGLTKHSGNTFLSA